MEPVNLLSLDSNGFKEFLDSFDHVFSDCDGVIWAETPLPKTGDFFKLMKKHGKTINYVSNNSIRTKAEYEAKFNIAGIENGYEDLTIPSLAIAEYLKSKNFNKKIYCISCTETRNVLKSYGFECVNGPNQVPDSYVDFLQFLKDDLEIGAVVFDSDYNVNLPKLYRACAYLNRPEVLFISGATDKTVPLKPGVMAIATGAFTDLVIEHVGRKPLQIGKPGKMFGEFAMRRAKVTNASRVLFIGDMIDQDVGLGKVLGFKTLLVLTNLSKEIMLTHPTIKPDFYADSLASIVSKFE